MLIPGAVPPGGAGILPACTRAITPIRLCEEREKRVTRQPRVYPVSAPNTKHPSQYSFPRSTVGMHNAGREGLLDVPTEDRGNEW